MKIAGYLRVSTQKQADFGVSIEMQREIIIKHAQTFDIIEDRNDIVFYEDEGYSAKSLERPAMKRLIEGIKNNDIEVLFVYDQARISRDIWDIKKVLELLNKYNVVLKCLYDDASIETANDRFRTYMGSLHNQYERERVCERTNDALASIPERGGNPIGGKPAFGYVRDDSKNFIIDEEQAKIVRNVFALACQHKSMDEIAIYLRVAVPDRKWKSETIKRMVENKKYAGILEYKGKEYRDIIPAIVSEEVFKRASIYYRHKSARASVKYYYDELVYCTKCKMKMTGRSSYGKKKQIYYYYYCRNCKGTFSQLLLNRVVAGEIYADGYIEHVDGVYEELFSAKRKYQKRISRLDERYVAETISEEEYLALKLPLMKQLEEVKMWIEEENIDDVAFSSLNTDKERHDYAQSRIKCIEVDNEARKVSKIVYLSRYK